MIETIILLLVYGCGYFFLRRSYKDEVKMIDVKIRAIHFSRKYYALKRLTR